MAAPPPVPETDADSAPRTAEERPAADSTEPPDTREIAILFNDDAPDYAEVAAHLTQLLPAERYRLILADVGAQGSRQILKGLRDRSGLFVVAVGLPAARLARDDLDAPMVFAQVFNYQELLVDGRPIRGVTAMPPLDLQLQDWKRLDPELRRVGVIVSERHAHLVREAERAAQAAAVTIQHEISSSDQETLYLFKRLAPQIDGLWLVPDDRILSPSVLRELLGYAVSHGIRVSVFSDALLPWGALLSASGTTEDVARTVRRVLERMIAGEADSLPTLTPLSELVVRVNEQVADRLGVTLPPHESWIVRSEP